MAWPEVAELEFEHSPACLYSLGSLAESLSPSSVAIPAACCDRSESRDSIITGFDLASRITMTKFVEMFTTALYFQVLRSETEVSKYRKFVYVEHTA